MKNADTLNRLYPPNERADAPAHRRGFHEAAAMAATASRGGCTPDDLARWADAVSEWRFGEVDGPAPLPGKGARR